MIDSLAQKLVTQKLAGIKGGQINLRDQDDRHQFGEPGKLSANVEVLDRKFYRRSITGGGLGAAESLIDGQWTCDDLTSLIRIFARNIEVADRMNRGLGQMKKWFEQFLYRFKRNSIRQAKQNIHEHYDLGNDFFRLFLDPTMSYSSGIFQRPDDSMFLASLNKLWRVCKKLDLKPEDHLLEIGTGWGGLAIFAATNFGCRVTTTTISEEQYLFAKDKVAALGLDDQIEVVQKDYRLLEGKFDKLVSIEMIEAVGHEFLQTFFRHCRQRLKPDGMMLLQSIVIRDQRFNAHQKNTDFIKKYIFPGGCLPSNLVLLQSMERECDFQVLNLEDIGMSYAQTLSNWKQAFVESNDQLQEIGFRDPRFQRMWHYYLCYCQAGFLERQISNVQLLVAARDSRSIANPSSWELSRTRLHQLENEWLKMEQDLEDHSLTATDAQDQNRFQVASAAPWECQDC